MTEAEKNEIEKAIKEGDWSKKVIQDNVRKILSRIDEGLKEYEKDMKALCNCSGAKQIIGCEAEEYCYWNKTE